MTTDKEELRNVINDSLFGFKDEEYGFTQAETAILIKVEKLLEAKDKEIDELKKEIFAQGDEICQLGKLLFKKNEKEVYEKQITDLKAEIERMKGELPSVDEAGPIAVAICEDVKPELSVTEQSIFIAGFQECIKYLNS